MAGPEEPTQETVSAADSRTGDTIPATAGPAAVASNEQIVGIVELDFDDDDDDPFPDMPHLTVAADHPLGRVQLELPLYPRDNPSVEL